MLNLHASHAGLGISVDEASTSTAPATATPPATTPRASAITGDLETVLKNNLEQLQWTSLSVSLLAASTALLGVAQDVPALLVSSHMHLEVARDALPELTGFGVDMSEQVQL